MTDLSTERIAWVDVETTGLDPYTKDYLLQVAVVVTDGHLGPLDEGVEYVVQYNPGLALAVRRAANDYVKAMHDKSGLWDKLPYGTPLKDVENLVLEYLQKHIEKPGTAKLGGNSITLDRKFLDKNLPAVNNYLHYRSLDITSWVGMFELAGVVPSKVPYFKKENTHTAMEDIKESIAEAKYYLDVLRYFI